MRISLSPKMFFMFFTVFPQLAAVYLDTSIAGLRILNYMLGIWQIIGVLLLIILTLKYIDKTFITLCLFIAAFFVSMLKNENTLNEIIAFIRSYIPVIALCLACSFYGKRKDMDFIKILHHLIYFLVLLNGLFLFLYPQGMFQSYTSRVDVANWNLYQRCNFLGVDNRLILPFISAIIIGELYNSICNAKHKKMRWMGYFFIYVQELYIWSGTGVLICTLLLLGIILIQFRPKGWKFNLLNYRNIVILYLLIFFLICIWGVISWFSPIIIEILGKDITLTNRTYIWALCIELIKEKICLGYGNCNNSAMILFNGYYWYAHNLIFDILLQGGVLSLIFFGIHIAMFNRKKTSNIEKKCVLGILSVLLVNIVESFVNYIYFYLPFYLFYILQYYENKEEKNLIE